MFGLLAVRLLALFVLAHQCGRDVQERVVDRLERDQANLRDETGAQAVEYALLIGVAAVACGAMILALRTKVIEAAVTGLVKGAVSFVSGWFKK